MEEGPCFQGMKIYIPPTSAFFGELARKVVENGGCVWPYLETSDLKISPEDVEFDGYYPSIIYHSIRDGMVPCLCKYNRQGWPFQCCVQVYVLLELFCITW
jgi:hypothetical protein